MYHYFAEQDIKTLISFWAQPVVNTILYNFSKRTCNSGTPQAQKESVGITLTFATKTQMFRGVNRCAS